MLPHFANLLLDIRRAMTAMECRSIDRRDMVLWGLLLFVGYPLFLYDSAVKEKWRWFILLISVWVPSVACIIIDIRRRKIAIVSKVLGVFWYCLAVIYCIHIGRFF